MRTHSNKIVALTIMASLMAGCATTEQGSAGQAPRQANSQTPEKDPCAVASSALAGAAVGALLGALVDGKKGAKRGAIAGGVVGTIGCLAMNSKSRQTRTAAQVDADFIQKRGRLPADPQVVSYTPRLASGVVQRGQAMHVSSVVELVNGAQTPVREVSEELVVYDTEGKQIKNGSKPLTINSGGRFENTFELTLPKDASQGVYAMKTNLYVNGKLSATRDLRTQLVWDGSAGRVYASR